MLPYWKMQFRAVSSNVVLSAEEWLYLRDVQCPVCYLLYRLWAPSIWTQQTDAAIHTDWLTQHLMNACPKHAEDIRTPHPSVEKFRTYWFEEARAHAIKEAEDAGLRGAEREQFIQKHTDVYYAELLLQRLK